MYRVCDDASIETAPTYPVPLRERFRWHPLDGLVAASVPIGGQTTIEVDWSRLGWWRARRRLRRRYGIVASQLDGSTWLLRDERSVRRPTLRVTSRCTAHRPD